MTDIQEKLVEFGKFLDLKQKELLQSQNEIHAFVGTEHKAKATEAYQKKVRELAKEVNNFVIALIETKEGAGEFQETAEKLCDRGMVLNGLMRDLNKALADDLAEKQKEEEFDVVKVSGVTASLIVLSIMVSKNTFDPDSTHVITEIAVGAGVGVSLPFCKKKKIRKLKVVSDALCRASQNIKNSSLLYYVKETTKDFGMTLVRPLISEQSFLLTAGNDNKSEFIRAKKVGNSLNPKP